MIARLAVGELIDTLSDNDFFNVIWVSKYTEQILLDFQETAVLLR